MIEMEVTNTRCKETIEAFVEYMNKNPDQRFFQGVRNMFRIEFLIADGNDTFSWEQPEKACKVGK